MTLLKPAFAPREREAIRPSVAIGMSIAIMYRHLRNDPLEVMWRESEMAMDFARNARYDDGAAMFVSQQRFIATMQGRTASLSTFSDAQFDEATFEAQLAGSGIPW